MAILIYRTKVLNRIFIDIEKLLNLENYTPEQIQDDLARQSIIKDYK